MQVETYVEASDGEYTIIWNVTSGRAAYITGPPEDCYPEEPGEAEAQYAFKGSRIVWGVEAFLKANGIDYDLAEEAAFEKANEDWAASQEDER